MYSSITVLVLETMLCASSQSLCLEGCKCKNFGYCYDCEEGYYKKGAECKRCSVNCLSCSSDDIKCEKCDIGFYAYSLSQSNISCLSCSDGCLQCKSNETCLKCKYGYFKKGHLCKKCLPQCKTCISESSCTTCVDGFFLNGTSCQKCPDGYFKSGSSCEPCQNNCASCSIINECTKCKQGFFGKTCEHRCSSGCKDNVCDKDWGNCICKQNHTGRNCKNCLPKKYGPDCNLDCPKKCPNCSSPDGVKCSNCLDGCADGQCNLFTGKCNLGCKIGYYGHNCSIPCKSYCGNESCSRESGLCDFETGAVMSQDIGTALLYASFTSLILAVVLIVISALRKNNHRPTRLNRTIVSVEESKADGHVRNWEEVLSSESLDHRHDVPKEASTGSVSLVDLANTARRQEDNSTEAKIMYINPIYVDTNISHEYEEVK